MIGYLLKIRMIGSTKMLELLKIQRYSEILLDLNSWKDGSKETKSYFFLIITHFISAIKRTKLLLPYEYICH